MTKIKQELDEFGRSTLAPLLSTPPIDPQVEAMEREKFLLHASQLRKDVLTGKTSARSVQPNSSHNLRIGKISFPIYRVLAIGLLVLIFITASTFTVYAAQKSLPGEPLYPIKSASEDIRLSMTVSPQARLNLTLEYTNRRIIEIQSLVSGGKSLPDQASDRFQNELEDALQLAAKMNDQQMEIALNVIKIQAGNQGMTIEELLARLPDKASPGIIRLKQRLLEQVQLSTIGEMNPQAFRKEIQERAQNRHGSKKSPTSDDQFEAPILSTVFPSNEQQGDSGGGMVHPTGEKGNGNGQSQPDQGNGNHGPNPTHTPRP